VPDDPFEAADLKVLRLKPSEFPELPKSLQVELQRRGCTIPQVPIKKRNNVIKGEFAKPGQTDWAVLCSIRRVSSLLVFWNGSGSDVSEIRKAPDIGYLQTAGGGKVEYSWGIDPVGEQYIVEHSERYPGPKPPPLDHEGINDAFVGKASVVHYFYKRNWLQLTGAD
jgi:hypothetical protein